MIAQHDNKDPLHQADIQMPRVFDIADDLGPEKVIHVSEPNSGLRGILVVDNTAAGPAIGGVRMAADADLIECARLARAMTLKNAMASLPHGGGKSVIIADPKAPAVEKARLMRAFAKSIASIQEYIPGPDMGTNESLMAMTKDVMGRAVGLPREIGGIPLDEIGATGYGLAIALDAAQARGIVNLTEARIVVQGFGSVGQHAARFLVERGARLIGVSDSQGARIAPEGFNLQGLLALKAEGASVAECTQGAIADHEDLIGVECEVWIPAARPDVLHEDNAGRMNARVFAQGANIPATAAAERLLAEQGTLVIPDFVANAGGVICASVEYHQGSQAQAFAAIAEKIRTNVQAMLTRIDATSELPRDAALAIAHQRVEQAMSYRHRF